jgi:type VI protein secretion system component VasK
MYRVGKATLLVLAFAGLAAMLFQFAWTVYGLLEDTPIDYIWGTLFILLCVAWVSYAKWLWSQWRSKRARVVKHNPDSPIPEWKAYAEAHQDDVDRAMAELESDVHDWSTRGDTPGSLAGSAIGLDAIDDFLEGGYD